MINLKTQFTPEEESRYSNNLWRIRMGLIRKYGSLAKVADLLEIDEVSLTKILYGAVDCNCKFFWLLFQMSDLRLR